MTHRQAKQIVRSTGMDIEDGLALTFACADYPNWIRAMNGWPVDDAAEEIVARGEKVREHD